VGGEEGTTEKISSSIYNKASPRRALRPLTRNPFAKTFVCENRKENSTYIILYLVHVKEHIIYYYNHIYNMIYPRTAQRKHSHHNSIGRYICLDE